MAEPDKPRYRAIDACRGLALVYMIYNHGFRLTVDPATMELEPGQLDWWLWLVCKAAPSLFFFCFGFMLGVIYMDPKRSFSFGQVSRRLWKRALLVFVSYKILLLLELAAFGKRPATLWLALQYRWLGQWVEILNFYAIVLLFAPPALWLWRRMPAVLRWLAPVVLAASVQYLQGFLWKNSILQAILVGRQGFYVFSILPWLLPVLLGLLFGELHPRLAARGRIRVVLMCLLSSLALFLLFQLGTRHLTSSGYAVGEARWSESGESPSGDLMEAVLFRWKHPPRLVYLAWTTAYAMLYVAFVFALMGVEARAPSRWAVLETIGRNSLFQFNLHFSLLMAGVGLFLGRLRELPAVEARWCGAALALFCMFCGVVVDRVFLQKPVPRE
ncbi:MAG: DUF1624 domain-containing protein [Armatimonadetes bacterium]|nr:DUF1624 domain-containing protein [Armatimonadota bacterium]